MKDYSFERTLEMSADSCFARISASLKNIGFVMLSYVDMQEIFKKNFSKNIEPYYILEVCKPSAALEMVGIREDYGLFLPCKIVIIQKGPRSRIMLARVSTQSADYLGADPKVARKYEDELTSMIASL